MQHKSAMPPKAPKLAVGKCLLCCSIVVVNTARHELPPARSFYPPRRPLHPTLIVANLQTAVPVFMVLPSFRALALLLAGCSARWYFFSAKLP